MPKVKVNGIEVYYETRVEGSPLTLINGWGDSMNSWSSRIVKMLYLLYPRDYVNANLEALILDETYVDHPTPDYALHRQSQAIAGFDSHDQLPHLRMPVLVMTGEDDVLVPPGNSETLAERIPGAVLVKIPGAGHGFLKQRTDEAVPKILGFLRRVDEG